ncbi:MAG: hypothetical protein LBP73_11510 [Clostridiales Family XIII bacterium]|jgi:hypothetical protein|nr:hypothetical protein [Clostridiales Family XIII bacterium]
MNAIEEIQNIRSEIMLKVDAAFTELIQKLESGSDTSKKRWIGNYETVYPITANPAIFKGKKPTAVMFGTERIDVSKWKTVVAEIMKRCNSDSEKHVLLMNLRGKISGRERVILAKEDDKMRSPMKISENLYIETHYDTETLLRTLMTRILDAVDYDYSGIKVAVRNAG